MDALIVGAGAHGRVILDIMRDSGGFGEIVFVDENPELRGRAINGAPVIGCLREVLALGPKGCRMIVALGNPFQRMRIAGELRAASIPLLNAIHPSAVVARTARIGSGNMIGATAVINSDAQLGDDVIVNTGAVVEHDCRVADGVVVGPGAHLGARVCLGRAAFIGTGAIVLSRVSVGAATVVGAGAVVTRDTRGSIMVLGIPAREVQQLDADFNWNRVL